MSGRIILMAVLSAILACPLPAQSQTPRPTATKSAVTTSAPTAAAQRTSTPLSCSCPAQDASLATRCMAPSPILTCGTVQQRGSSFECGTSYAIEPVIFNGASLQVTGTRFSSNSRSIAPPTFGNVTVGPSVGFGYVDCQGAAACGDRTVDVINYCKLPESPSEGQDCVPVTTRMNCSESTTMSVFVYRRCDIDYSSVEGYKALSTLAGPTPDVYDNFYNLQINASIPENQCRARHCEYIRLENGQANRYSASCGASSGASYF